jgi:hypothetical protein
MTYFYVTRKGVLGALLIATLALAGASCSNEVDGLDPLTSGLRNGSDQTQRLRGLADISDDHNDLSSDLSRVHCSGIMLMEGTFLTTARCAEKVMRPGYSVDYTRALRPEIYSWFSGPDGGFKKHCVDGMVPCSQMTQNSLGGGETFFTAKAEKVNVYSLTSSPENDLAIFTSSFYPHYGYQDDFADIYMDDFTPSTMPRLQLYGWGRAPDTTVYPLPVPRTGTMQVRAVTASRIDLNPDQVQACAGDEGGAWVIPQSLGGSGNQVVALESSFTPDPSTGCSQSGSLDRATRLRDKMSWIESIIGPCQSYTDPGGHQAKRCGASVCTPAPDGWNGCNGSGCSVCSSLIDSAYPKYFDHHRSCSRNTACNGSYSRCSAQCPPPSPEDSCEAAPAEYPGWNGCRGSGCSACSDVIDSQYPKYFLRHPECARNTTCNGSHYRCSPSCPPPTDQDR